MGNDHTTLSHYYVEPNRCVSQKLRCSIHGFGFSLLASSDSLSNQWLNSVNFDRCKGITNGFLRGTTKLPYS